MRRRSPFKPGAAAFFLLCLGFGLAPNNLVQAQQAGAGAFDRNDNGLWMRRHWLHEGPAQAEIEALVRGLRAHGIRRIYPFLGPMDREGWPGLRSKAGPVRYQPELAGTFFSGLHRMAPEI